MIEFLSAQHRNRISVPQTHITKKYIKRAAPIQPLKKHFLAQKRYPRRGPFFGHMLHFRNFDYSLQSQSLYFSHQKIVATLVVTIAMERA